MSPQYVLKIGRRRLDQITFYEIEGQAIYRENSRPYGKRRDYGEQYSRNLYLRLATTFFGTWPHAINTSNL